MEPDQFLTQSASAWRTMIARLRREADHPGTYRLSTGSQSRMADALADYLARMLDDAALQPADPVTIALDWDSLLTIMQLRSQPERPR